MFSVLASTRPTAPTADSNFAVGGTKGGGSAWRTGFIATTAATAKIRARTAIRGVILFIILFSCRERPRVWPDLRQHDGHRCKVVGSRAGLPLFLYGDYPAIVHVGDLVGKIKNPRIMGDNDDCAVWTDCLRPEQPHDRMACPAIKG